MNIDKVIMGLSLLGFSLGIFYVIRGYLELETESDNTILKWIKKHRRVFYFLFSFGEQLVWLYLIYTIYILYQYNNGFEAGIAYHKSQQNTPCFLINQSLNHTVDVINKIGR